jgi:hypothetical protein
MAGMAMVDDQMMDEEMPATSDINAGAMLAAGKPVTAMSDSDYDTLGKGFQMIGDGTDKDMVEQATSMMEPVIMANADRQAEVQKVKQGEFRDADSFIVEVVRRPSSRPLMDFICSGSRIST